MFRKKLIILLPIILLMGCNKTASQSIGDADGMLNVEVMTKDLAADETVTVAYSDIVENYTISAEKTYYYKDEIKAPTAVGKMTVSKLYFDSGDRIKKGDKLIAITRSYDSITRTEYEAETERLTAEFELNCQEYDKKVAEADAIYQASAMSGADYLTYNEVVFEYSCYKEETLKKLEKRQEVSLEYDSIDTTPVIYITSDFDGIINYNSKLKKGSNVNSGAGIFTVIDTSTVYYVVEKNIDKLHTGMDVSIKTEDTVINGSVFFDGNLTGEGYSLISIKDVNGKEDYTDEELPESVEFNVEAVLQKHILVVPEKAVKNDDSMYVIRRDGESDHRVYIESPAKYDKLYWVTEGLSEGDVLVIK